MVEDQLRWVPTFYDEASEEGASDEVLNAIDEFQGYLNSIDPKGFLLRAVGKAVERDGRLMLSSVSPGTGETGFSSEFPLESRYMTGKTTFQEESRHTRITPDLFNIGSVVQAYLHDDSCVMEPDR